MNLTGFSIFDIYGVKRIPLNGEYTAESLANTFIENWIPYYECHKCGRWDYCKYAKPHPANTERSEDIHCGVTVNSIRNFVHITFEILERLEREKIQNYLDGAFFFYKFVDYAEHTIGDYLNKDFHEYLGDYAPHFFGRMTPIIESLNSVCSYWKEIPDFFAKHPVLFVEGYSEKNFLDEMRKSHDIRFLNLHIEVYGGKGNRRLKRIQMLLDNYVQQGYVIYAQGDADGESTDIFRRLIESGSINEKNIFVFKHDFESSIPLSLLYLALNEMQLGGDMTEKDFKKRLGNGDISVVKKLKEKLSIDISSCKPGLARTVARILNYRNFRWIQDEKFMKESELGRFLGFVLRMI